MALLSWLSKRSTVMSLVIWAITASLRSRIKCQKGLIVWMVDPLIKQYIKMKMIIIRIRIELFLTQLLWLTKCQKFLPDGTGSYAMWLAWFLCLYSFLVHLLQILISNMPCETQLCIIFNSFKCDHFFTKFPKADWVYLTCHVVTWLLTIY